MAIPVYKVSVPEYHFRSEPDHGVIGGKIDACLKRHFLNKKVVIRTVGSQEHRGKTVDELIKIIKRLGTDRYDPKRVGDRYENIEGKRIDIFALDFKVTNKGKYFERFVEPFYTWPMKAGGKPIRLDIAIIYDRAQVKRVNHRYQGRKDIKKDGFVFKHPESKVDAILGIIKIL